MRFLWILIALLFVTSNVQAEIRGSGFPSGLPNTGGSGGLSPSNGIFTGNVGIFTATPGQQLDIVGNGRFTGGISTATWTDPIVDYHCAGIITTTTGSITSGTATLVVASASGWSIGMGIAVANAGAGGTTELITTISNISGTTFTLNNNASATASAQTVNHDDTACLNTAVNSGKNVHIRGGGYNVTSAILFALPVHVVGDGWADRAANPNAALATRIYNRGTTNNVLDLTNTNANNIIIEHLGVEQASGITPTAGWGWITGNASVNVFYPVLNFVTIRGTFSGAKIGNFVTGTQFDHVILETGQSGSISFQLSDTFPYGANRFSNMVAINTGTPSRSVYITAADQATFTNVTMGGGGGTTPSVEINDSTSLVNHVTFSGFTIENTSGAVPQLKISSASGNNVTGITFSGGEITNGTTTQAAVEIDDFASNINFTNISVANASTGFDILTTESYVSVTNCNFNGITGGGSAAFHLGSGANHVTISDNVYGVNVSSGLSDTAGSPTNTYEANSDGKSFSSGNVGIGTWIANQLLQIHSAASQSGLSITANGTTAAGNKGLQLFLDTDNNGNLGMYNQTKMNFFQNGINRMAIDTNGNVGIGTVVPSQGFEFAAAAGAIATVTNRASNNYAVFRFRNDQFGSTRVNEIGYTGSAYVGPYWTNGITGETGIVGTEANFPLSFGTNATQRMLITGAGNVGVGTNIPGSTLEVKGTLSVRGAQTSPFTVKSGANAACDTTCGTSMCNVAFDTTAGVYTMVACSSATADICSCLGP